MLDCLETTSWDANIIELMPQVTSLITQTTNCWGWKSLEVALSDLSMGEVDVLEGKICLS